MSAWLLVLQLKVLVESDAFEIAISFAPYTIKVSVYSDLELAWHQRVATSAGQPRHGNVNALKT